MSKFKFFTSLTQSLVQDATSFKNELISKQSLNENIFISGLNWFYTLSDQKTQLNLTEESEASLPLDFYLPISGISFSMESQLSNSNKTKNYPFNKLSFEENINLIKFEELPINLRNNTIEKTVSFSIFLIDEELTFNSYNSTSDIFFGTNDKNDHFDLGYSDKKIECGNYTPNNIQDGHFNYCKNNHQIRKSLYDKRSRYYEEYISLNNALNNSTNNTSFSSTRGNLSIKMKKESKCKQIIIKETEEMVITEFEGGLSKKIVQYYLENMNANYLRYMLVHYSKIEKEVEQMDFCKEKMFLNLVKAFLGKIGVCDKKIYEETLRNIVYNQINPNFEMFLSCFNYILKGQDEGGSIKYKFLINGTMMTNEEKFNGNHIKKFNEGIVCKSVYEEDITFDIIDNGIPKFYSVYPKYSNKIKYPVNNLGLVLESMLEER